jgi:hypothetical protein
MAMSYTWIRKALAQDEYGDCTKAIWMLEGTNDVTGKTDRASCTTVFRDTEVKAKSAWTQAEIDAYAEVARGAGSLDSTLVNLTS